MANIDERTEIACQKMAEFLKELMKNKAITAEDLIKMGVGRQQVYSVLRMGAVEKPDYKISTLITILSLVGVHLEMHDLGERSNNDLINRHNKN